MFGKSSLRSPRSLRLNGLPRFPVKFRHLGDVQDRELSDGPIIGFFALGSGYKEAVSDQPGPFRVRDIVSRAIRQANAKGMERLFGQELANILGGYHQGKLGPAARSVKRFAIGLG